MIPKDKKAKEDKKQKEEKTRVLGQAALDLLPYVVGELPSKDTRTLCLHRMEDVAVEERVRGSSLVLDKDLGCSC